MKGLLLAVLAMLFTTCAVLEPQEATIREAIGYGAVLGETLAESVQDAYEAGQIDDEARQAYADRLVVAHSHLDAALVYLSDLNSVGSLGALNAALAVLTELQGEMTRDELEVDN